MKYLHYTWRGLQLALDLYFLRLFGLELIREQLSWYLAIVYWLGMGAFMALAMRDFLLLKALLEDRMEDYDRL